MDVLQIAEDLGLPKSEYSSRRSYGRPGDMVTGFQNKIFIFPDGHPIHASRRQRSDISLRGEIAAKRFWDPRNAIASAS
jgi:hypothetical protein